MSFQREIVGGRLSGEGATELGIRPAMLIEDALTRLRELRRRYSRYRHYDRTSLSTAGLESLRYKTGWILAGVMSDDSWEPSFEFAEGTLPSRTLPRSGARIRMTRDESVFILGFGARGEQLRKRRPALHSMHVFDDTSTHAKSGLVYTVADVRVEWVPDEGARYVWLRLVAP